MKNITAIPVLFSIKPFYANLIFEGIKTAELRRRIFSNIKDRDVFIYVSSPTKQIQGGFRAGQVLQGTPKEIWNQVSEIAKIEKQDFDAYYAKRKIAYALQITDVWEYVNPVSLDTLRKRFPQFVVPQSWRYVKYEEYKSFRSMKRKRGEITPKILVA